MNDPQPRVTWQATSDDEKFLATLSDAWRRGGGMAIRRAQQAHGLVTSARIAFLGAEFGDVMAITKCSISPLCSGTILITTDFIAAVFRGTSR
jgi:hypothetical protein